MFSLRFVVDKNIPCVEEAFGRFGTIDRYPGHAIGPSEVREADVLLVRSVTPVEAPLLAESAVRFVGSATIGTDHIDREYLAERGIDFAHAPASNANSVADYVVVALLALARRRQTPIHDRTVGIIGCGNIGGRLADRLSALGLTVLRHDPPLQAAAEAANRSHDYVSLETVLDRANVLTLHVPLTTDGPHSTYHLIDDEILERTHSEAWILNTSRGAVVDGEALLSALQKGRVGAAVLDVWEGEPTPPAALVRAVDVATPHIAGYAYDGKVRGTVMLYEALCDHLGVEATWTAESALATEDPDTLRCRPPDPRLCPTDWLYALARQTYDLWADDARMRQLLDGPSSEWGEAFRRLRAEYPLRREMQRYSVPATGIPERYRAAIEKGLTIQPR